MGVDSKMISTLCYYLPIALDELPTSSAYNGGYCSYTGTGRFSEEKIDFHDFHTTLLVGPEGSRN